MMRRRRNRSPRRLAHFAIVATLSLPLWISSSISSAVTGSAPSTLNVPLTTSTNTSTTTWAIVTMGQNDQQNDLFPQLFALDENTKRWRLATPPGVADNGGLFLATGTGDALVVGFGTNRGLAFSPLARSVDGGRHWSPGGLQRGLARVPSALALSGPSTALALVQSGGEAQVLQSNGALTSWSTMLTAQTLATTAPSCSISAVGIGPANSAIIGAACTKSGMIGLFTGRAGHWNKVAAALPANLRGASVQVLAIEHRETDVAALLALHLASHTLLVVAYPSAGATWQLSKPLTLASGSTIVATGGGVKSAVFVLLRGTKGAYAVTNAMPNTGWQELPALPKSTTGVAIEPSGLVDALVVNTSTLTIWREPALQRALEKVQQIVVPIQYGSSA